LTGAPAAPGGRAGAQRSIASAEEPLVRVVFVVLVLACFAAFFITQRLKHTPTAIQDFKRTPRFSPFPSGHLKEEEISFKLARADEVTVAILDSAEDVVATLLRSYPAPRYKQFSLRWNGHRGTAFSHRITHTASGRVVVVPENRGPIAAPGEYRVWVSLRRQDRTLVLPESFTLVGEGG
jgi:hypothetical protein